MSGLAEKLRQTASTDYPKSSVVNLPPPDFVLAGRSSELEAAKTKFLSKLDGRRLLLFGQPGVGTTRFALELAEWARSIQNYDFALWINCQRFQVYGGRRLSAPNFSASLNEVVKEIAHYTGAEAALKSTGREALLALNSRCSSQAILLVVDGLQAEFSKEIESFIHSQPANFDIIATSKHDLGWRNSVELRPWAWNSPEAAAFLAGVDAELGWQLPSAKREVALRAGSGIPSGIVWSGRLLHEGYPEEVVEDLGHEGWDTLLGHFFSQQFNSEVRTQSAKRAAALLAISGGLAESVLNEVVDINSSGTGLASRLLMSSGFCTTSNGLVRPVPFAGPFLRRRLSGSKKLNSAVFRDWLQNLSGRLRGKMNAQNWMERFSELEPLFGESIAAFDASTVHGEEAEEEFIQCFDYLAYFLYSRAYWDEFERYQERFLDICLNRHSVDLILEVLLVWGARIMRQRYSSEQAESFFALTVDRLRSNCNLSAKDNLRLQVAQLGFRSPHKFGASLAEKLGDLASKLEVSLDLEWACRAQLYSGNAWAEAGDLDLAEEAYGEIARICGSSLKDADRLWSSEMVALSASSRGVLANRRGDFGLGAKLLSAHIVQLAQASDRATALGELALAYSKIGSRREGRANLSQCLELRKRIVASGTVMESCPGWELNEGAADLFSRKGLEWINPWWR